MRGKFIVVEGVDFTGKTTQVNKIHEFLKEKNIPHILTREPGGTKLGEVIRELILENKEGTLSKEAVLLLFMSARAENISKVIKPALEAGTHVICDRFLASTIVYQGVLSGFSLESILEAHKNFNYNLFPDLSILLDAKLETLLERRDLQTWGPSLFTDPKTEKAFKEANESHHEARRNNKFDFLPKEVFSSLKDEFLKTSEIKILNTKIAEAEKSPDEVFLDVKTIISKVLGI
jgi:dTMP kinase